MEKKCSERIGNQLQDRINDMRADLEHDSEEPALDPLEVCIELYDYVNEQTTWRILLLWRGPSDWFSFAVDHKGEIVSADYHFADWFDHAEVKVTGADLETASAWLQRFTYLE